jgi:hypothetical protein
VFLNLSKQDVEQVQHITFRKNIQITQISETHPKTKHVKINQFTYIITLLIIP